MDLIERQAAIDVLAAMQGRCTSKAALIQNSKIWQQIKDLPSVQPVDKDINVSCKDAISRQAAIEAVETKIKKWNAVDGEGYHVGLGLRYTDVIDTLTELPSAQPEPHWIPCSERLPEDGKYVLVSKKPLGFRSNLPNVCTAHRSHDPRSGKEEWYDMLLGKLYDDDVLAWMPLPEPYLEEGE